MLFTGYTLVPNTYQDTQLCVSDQESLVMHKCGTANSPFSTPCISITTGPISIKFTYFMPSIYATLHTKLVRNQPNSLWDVFLKSAPFSSPFSSSHRLTKVTLSQSKTPFPWINFFYIWHTYKAFCGLSQPNL